MKLPNAENAVVEREKITDYLLNPAHPDNGGKAPFFLSHGFRPEHRETLATAFRRLAGTTEVHKSVASAYGQKYMAMARWKLLAAILRWCEPPGLSIWG